MIRVTVKVTNRQALDRLSPDAFVAAVRRGAFMGAQFVQGVWVRLAQAMDVRATGEYIRGIDATAIVTVREERDANHFLIALFAGNDAPHAGIVEYGHRAFRFPDAINWGSKAGRVKMGKKGPYLHIPFRHRAFASEAKADTQGLTRATRKAMMPEDVYREAMKLARTVRHNTGPQRAPDGQFLRADTYTYGGRLTRPNAAPDADRARFLDPLSHVVGPHHKDFAEWRGVRFVGRDHAGNALVNPGWKSSKFEGLMKTGPARHTSYMTIRTVTPNSPGWNIPAQAGRHVAAAAAMASTNGGRLSAVVVSHALATIGGAP